MLTVSRTGGSDGAVGATWVTVDGTATAAGDFLGGFGPVSWAAGDSADKTITIPISSDSLVEGNETFTVTLGNPTGGATIGAQASILVTIVDDDATPPALSQAIPAAFQAAAGGW
jgi:hypothetical protein